MPRRPGRPGDGRGAALTGLGLGLALPATMYAAVVAFRGVAALLGPLVAVPAGDGPSVVVALSAATAFGAALALLSDGRRETPLHRDRALWAYAAAGGGLVTLAVTVARAHGSAGSLTGAVALVLGSPAATLANVVVGAAIVLVSAPAVAVGHAAVTRWLAPGH